ncbi:Uncharacterised protein [Chlamydia abortus]|nr:Uncharacterised protein [Chlamydia abortus]
MPYNENNVIKSKIQILNFFVFTVAKYSGIKYKGIEHKTNGNAHLATPTYFQYQLPDASKCEPASNCFSVSITAMKTHIVSKKKNVVLEFLRHFQKLAAIIIVTNKVLNTTIK